MLEQEEQRDELLEKIEDLISRKRYAELRDLLLPLEAQDIAGLFMELDDKVPMVFRLLPKEQAAEVFVELDSEEQEVLIQSFSNTELKEVLDELYLDDTVDIVEEMPANVVKRILRHADPDIRKSINEILKYPDDCAGSIMTTEFVDLKATMTVEDALEAHPPHRPGQGDHQHLLRHRRRAPPAGRVLHPDPAAVARRTTSSRTSWRPMSSPSTPWTTRRTWPRCSEQIRLSGPARGGHGEPPGGHRHRGRRHGRSAGGGHRGH